MYIVVALKETMRLMEEIDDLISAWPIESGKGGLQRLKRHLAAHSRLRLMLSESKKEERVATNKLYVGNLSYRTTEDELREAFSAYGDVLSVRIIEGRGFGFVEMESSEAAEHAKDGLNETELGGRTIRVDDARPPKQRERRRRRY
jgi:RNA recognition motif-containing protein